MTIELLKEPHLEYGNDFVSDDPKMGLAAGGFFSLSNNTHRSELHYAVIGTQNNIEEARKWIEQFENSIEAVSDDISIIEDSTIEDGIVRDNILDMLDDGSLFQELAVQSHEQVKAEIKESNTVEGVETTYSTVNKKLNPDFPGFNSEHPFYCRFVNDAANNKIILESKIKEILEDAELKAFDKLVRLCDLYIEAYKFILSKSVSKPDVCIIALPTKLVKRLGSIPSYGNRFFNLRRYLKAQLITLNGAIPVQIIIEDTLKGSRRSLQDLSMQAWNFCVANYYKNTGTPWTLSLKDKNSCFIGISFHKVLSSEQNVLRSSVAQAFNYEGKGIIFVGDQFEWDSKTTHTPAPHLKYDYAKDLIAKVIKEYKAYNNNLSPTRIVVHKTTDFWDSKINRDYAEVEGLKDGIREVLGNDVIIDLVSIKSADLKLLRKQGNYPVIRGTLLHIDEVTGVLYTTGYVPYFETFPGLHIPHPLEISIYEAESTLKKISEEILALTKMNFNNCNYYNSLPITIQFAQKVGEIIQYIDENAIPPNKYYYYM